MSEILDLKKAFDTIGSIILKGQNKKATTSKGTFEID